MQVSTYNGFADPGDRPGVRVSRQVTAIRHDPWALAHWIVVEEEKPLAERVTCLDSAGDPRTGNSVSFSDANANAERAVR